MKTGVVADDITGANDIGIMYAKNNYTTHVYNLDQYNTKGNKVKPDVLILNTDSRLDDAKTAYDKVYKATKLLKKEKCAQFYNKTCSVFRGNIGVEFDAMLDALGKEVAYIVLGFPKNGRCTINGVHYVHGKKLEESEFKDDPANPMKKSDLVEILGSQTKRKVGKICLADIKKGYEQLIKIMYEKSKIYNYIIFDVESQNDLTLIARVLKDEKIICGSSALSEEIAKIWEAKKQGTLCLSGSLMPQTKRQVRYLIDNNVKEIKLKTDKIFKEDENKKEIERIVNKANRYLVNGDDVILHTIEEKDEIEKTIIKGQKYGLKKRQISRLVSRTISKIAYQIFSNHNLKSLVVAGGETSSDILKKLGINGLRVYKEIEPGLPSCISLTEERVFLVLKSGSFGSDDFLMKAIKHLKEEKI